MKDELHNIYIYAHSCTISTILLVYVHIAICLSLCACGKDAKILFVYIMTKMTAKALKAWCIDDTVIIDIADYK